MKAVDALPGAHITSPWAGMVLIFSLYGLAHMAFAQKQHAVWHGWTLLIIGETSAHLIVFPYPDTLSVARLLHLVVLDALIRCVCLVLMLIRLASGS